MEVLQSVHCDEEMITARAGAYGFLSAIFRQPSADLLAELAMEERWAVWPEVVAEWAPAAGAALESFRDALRMTPSPEALMLDHIDLFGHTLRGKCPMYELEFGEGEIFQKTAELADIGGFYSAFGVEIPADEGERADHVAIECEFMALLALKEALALEKSDETGLGIIRAAQRGFLQDHLAAWLPAFSLKVEQQSPASLYAAAARFAGAFIEADCRSRDVICGTRFLELRPTHVDLETEINCMTAENCGTCPMESLMPSVAGADPEDAFR